MIIPLPNTTRSARSGAQPLSGTAGRATPSCRRRQTSSSELARPAELCSANSGDHLCKLIPSRLQLSGGINHRCHSRSSSQACIFGQFLTGRTVNRTNVNTRSSPSRRLIGCLTLPDCLTTNGKAALLLRPRPQLTGPRP